MVRNGQRQHVDMYRKVLLRRRLLRKAVEGAAYVPFIGDGDLAVELYQDRRIYGADIDEDRCNVAWERLRGADIRVADCDRWPFEDVTETFAVADFDASSSPYESFRAFWGHANKQNSLVLYFTDGQRQSIIRSGVLNHPSGAVVKYPTVKERRPAYNFYYRRIVLPWFEEYIAPWQVVQTQFYTRGVSMLYWGVVVAHG